MPSGLCHTDLQRQHWFPYCSLQAGFQYYSSSKLLMAKPSLTPEYELLGGQKAVLLISEIICVKHLALSLILGRNFFHWLNAMSTPTSACTPTPMYIYTIPLSVYTYTCICIYLYPYLNPYLYPVIYTIGRMILLK